MASFMENLWTSIFTPGPTPSLLIATNVTFAALQLVLITCLFVTWSIHFVVLAVLSGCLWWSVNWFARELAIAQAAHARQEEREKMQRTSAGSSTGGSGSGAGKSSLDTADSGDDTETEEANKIPGQQQQRRPKRETSAGVETIGGQQSGASLSTGTFNTAAAARLAPEGVKQRRNLAESTGDLSTDSEWEQVDNE